MNPPLNLYGASATLGFMRADAAPADNPQCGLLTGLIKRLAAGDEAALGHFYDITLARVFGLALRITGRRDLAEDVCVETYWQAWREAVRFDLARGQPLAWLMVMTRSRALDALRRLDHVSYCEDPESLMEAAPAPESSPLDCLLHFEAAGVLTDAVAALTPIQRQMVALAFYKDLSHQEIACQTGLPLGTVKSHLKRAQEHLRKTLGQA